MSRGLRSHGTAKDIITYITYVRVRIACSLIWVKTETTETSFNA